MTGISRALLFMVSCVFAQNVVFTRLLGCEALGEGRDRLGTAVGLGLVVTAVMALTSLLGWMAWQWVLVPLGAEYLLLLVLVLIIAALAALAGATLGRVKPAIQESLGDVLPLIAANCAVLGVAILNIESGYGLGDAFLSGLFGGLGFLLAMVLMAGVQERISTSKVPEAMKGLPISLVSASLIALAFMGFIGLG